MACLEYALPPIVLSHSISERFEERKCINISDIYNSICIYRIFAVCSREYWFILDSFIIVDMYVLVLWNHALQLVYGGWCNDIYVAK